MRIKNIVSEDFLNYKKSSMFIITCLCDWKCCHEAHIDESVCQNNSLLKNKTRDIKDECIVDSYLNNDITEAIVFGGLEPLLQFNELVSLISKFREKTEDDIVIYTGYYPSEIEKEINILKKFSNIIIKFGRYIPNRCTRYDDVLGVTLASDNQYAEKIS